MSAHAFGHTWSEAPEVTWEREHMRPRVARRTTRFLILMAIGALLAAGGMATARADSSETAFLDTLTDSGVQVYDASQAVETGWAICEAFETVNGADVARYIYANTTYADVPDLATAQVWVVAAGMTLCPWHNHANRVGGVIA